MIVNEREMEEYKEVSCGLRRKIISMVRRKRGKEKETETVCTIEKRQDRKDPQKRERGKG